MTRGEIVDWLTSSSSCFMMADSPWMLMYLCCHSACSSLDCLTLACKPQCLTIEVWDLYSSSKVIHRHRCRESCNTQRLCNALTQNKQFEPQCSIRPQAILRMTSCWLAGKGVKKQQQRCSPPAWQQWRAAHRWPCDTCPPPPACARCCPASPPTSASQPPSSGSPCAVLQRIFVRA